MLSLRVLWCRRAITTAITTQIYWLTRAPTKHFHHTGQILICFSCFFFYLKNFRSHSFVRSPLPLSACSINLLASIRYDFILSVGFDLSIERDCTHILCFVEFVGRTETYILAFCSLVCASVLGVLGASCRRRRRCCLFQLVFGFALSRNLFASQKTKNVM